MMKNYDSRNSLEYYDVGNVYAFPVISGLAGVPLNSAEEKEFSQMISILNTNEHISEVGNNYSGMVRVPGIVVDKERDGLNSRIVVVIRVNNGGITEYQCKKYACFYTGAMADGADIPLVDEYTFATDAIHASIGSLPKVFSVDKKDIHTGPVEKSSKANIHTGPVEKDDSSTKHTGPVEKIATASKHTGPVEKIEENNSHTGPTEKI